MTDSKVQLKFYNSITKQLEVFEPKKGNAIDWYICGPTVYDSPYIGHARTYISFDVIRRVLEEYFGYNVNYAMNITDVDDKIINKAREIQQQTNKNDIASICKEITEKYEKEFFDDMKLLHVQPPTFLTRVTEFIAQIEKFIEQLVDKNMAYKMQDSVYFDINEYKKHFDYPVFVSQSAIKDEDEACNAVNNISIEHTKKNIADFVLWKGRDKDLYYDTKFGTGRPGWHIECSTMAANIFPNGLDIHSGGIDLSFPHHENEIAQNQALTNKKWINYFLHTGHLHIDGLKMSKSLKNFITIQDFAKEYTARQIRFSFLVNKWWQPMTYSKESMQYAVNLEQKLFTFVSVLESEVQKKEINNVCFTEQQKEEYSSYEMFKQQVHVALCDNIDTATALKHVFAYIATCNAKLDKIDASIKKVILDYFCKILRIFGLMQDNKKEQTDDTEKLLCMVNDLRNEIRMLAKNKADYTKLYGVCDKLRDNLKDLGYAIDDKEGKSVIRKI